MRKKHSLVVGGTKGIGRATALMLAALGQTVSVIARHAPEKKISGAHYWSADLADSANLPRVLGEIVRKNGKISNLVFFQRHRGKDNDWHGEIETSLTGTKNLIDLATKHFERAGSSIVLCSSINSRLITRHLPVGYHLGKAGLNQLARYYAVALGPQGIRVNSVSPATVLKEESKAFFLKNKPLLSLYQKMIPLGRIGTAEEVARTILFLCSDSASFITGQDIVIDGGLTLLYQEALVREIVEGKKPSPKK